MDPTESLDWYSGLHIVEEGEDAAAAAAAARAAEKQPEESISSVIGSAFSGMVSIEDCMMSGLMQQHQQPPVDLQQQQQLRPSVLQHTNDHQHRHCESQPPHQSHSRHIIQSTTNHQDHAHHHQSVIVQPSTVTSSGSAGYGSGHFPSSSFLPPSTSTASNLFLPHSFMGLSFPEFETSQLPYPVLHSSHQHPSLDLFDPNHWMGVLDGKKEGGGNRRPSFTEAIFPQVFGTAAGQGILDFGSCAAAAAASASVQQQQQHQHAAIKHDPLDALYLSPSLPSTLSSPSLISSSLQAPPTPKGLLVGGGGGVGTVSSGYGTGATVIREAVLDMEKPEDREMMEQECQVCMATTANGLHFGARTCAACAAFFRRSVADAKQYQCKGSQRCTNSAKDGTGYRKICRACRLQRCLQIGMQPEKVADVQNKRFRKEDMPMGGTMISDLVGKGQGKGTAIDSLLKMNFNQPFGTMGQIQLQQQSHLHQSAPQSFYC